MESIFARLYYLPLSNKKKVVNKYINVEMIKASLSVSTQKKDTPHGKNKSLCSHTSAAGKQ